MSVYNPTYGVNIRNDEVTVSDDTGWAHSNSLFNFKRLVREGFVDRYQLRQEHTFLPEAGYLYAGDAGYIDLHFYCLFPQSTVLVTKEFSFHIDPSETLELLGDIVVNNVVPDDSNHSRLIVFARQAVRTLTTALSKYKVTINIGFTVDWSAVKDWVAINGGKMVGTILLTSTINFAQQQVNLMPVSREARLFSNDVVKSIEHLHRSVDAAETVEHSVIRAQGGISPSWEMV